jgi:hypothetical protein
MVNRTLLQLMANRTLLLLMVRILLHRRANKNPLRPAARGVQMSQFQARKVENKVETFFQASMVPQSLAPVQAHLNPRQKTTTQIAKNTDHR